MLKSSRNDELRGRILKFESSRLVIPWWWSWVGAAPVVVAVGRKPREILATAACRSWEASRHRRSQLIFLSVCFQVKIRTAMISFQWATVPDWLHQSWMSRMCHPRIMMTSPCVGPNSLIDLSFLSKFQQLLGHGCFLKSELSVCLCFSP